MSLKKAFSYMLCLSLLCALCVPALAVEELEGPRSISSVEDLELLRADPTGSYILTADLDLNGVDWRPIAFQGTFNGNGHTIYNLHVTSVGEDRAETVDGNNKTYDTVFAGFFSTLINAKVTSLTLQGVDIEITSPESCFIGGLAGYSRGSEITDCDVVSARLTLVTACVPDSSGRVSANTGVGGIVGFGTGTIADCAADVTLVYDDQSDPKMRCEEFLGGIIACGNAAIRDCTVNLQGYAATHGYAHSGGLIGMFYVFDKSEAARPISRSSVDGMITFYENNRDRRAYCGAFWGELLTWTNASECSQSFVANEVFNYSARLYPEQCDEPQLIDSVSPADCYNVGYTVHTCAVCDNKWVDSFVPTTHQPGDWIITQPATYETSGVKSLICTLCNQIVAQATIAPHVAGDWVTVRLADYGVDGLAQKLCTDCGEVLEEQVTPALIPASSIVLEPAALELSYQDSAVLQWTVYPAGADNTSVRWTTSNSDIVTIDTNGTVHAVGGGGTVTITCTSADGFAQAECTVTVKLTFAQWFQRYILFGWVWKH